MDYIFTVYQDNQKLDQFPLLGYHSAGDAYIAAKSIFVAKHHEAKGKFTLVGFDGHSQHKLEFEIS